MQNAYDISMDRFPRAIDTGLWEAGHIQGIAVDAKNGFIYYSYTTVLVKADLSGNVIGFVEGLTGHLGCIDFNEEDGKVYGSIEYKHDSIGQGIMKQTGKKLAEEDAFYIAIFDVDKIDRVKMDAEKDGIMKAVYLPEVVDDFNAEGVDGKPHRYAASGIDGTAFGPEFGKGRDGRSMLTVAYGIYRDVDRTDNDYQVLRQYDWRAFDAVAIPLVQGEPHHSGILCEERYFVFTGNTDWGVQNLEYDAYTGDWFAAVYKGKKPEYPNRPLYIIDGARAPEMQVLKGCGSDREEKVLFLKEAGIPHESGVYGWDFPYGSTGLYSFGNGYFYVSQNASVKINGGTKRLQTSVIRLYRFTGEAPLGFEAVE
ncbi:MAG: hypothetical protein J6B77_03690 [Clostridia bacterium]|nr:hypothetical protein [Clostridia bacterium]